MASRQKQAGTDSASAGAQSPAPKRGGSKSEFTVTSALRHDGELYEAGENVDLTQAEFAALKAAGVVEGDWPAD